MLACLYFHAGVLLNISIVRINFDENETTALKTDDNNGIW